MSRLPALEGLRAYLALWVIVTHMLWVSGYESLPWPFGVVMSPAYAVNGFVVLSGFVIALLIDTKQEAYGPYIVRRFFRLFPVFALLFLLAIPMALLAEWIHAHANGLLTAEQIADRSAKVQSWWDWAVLSIPLHLMMLHGVVPDALAPHIPTAFLTPAWSISLEWQFYLVAPLLYALLVKNSWIGRIAMIFSLFIFAVSARHIFPHVEFGAFLPFHLKWFALGALLYWIYRQYGKNWNYEFLPLTHPAVRYMGQISYSIYLSHALVLTLMQAALLWLWPNSPALMHLMMLGMGMLAGTLLISMALYRFVEVPGMEMGKRWAERQVMAKSRFKSAGAMVSLFRIN